MTKSAVSGLNCMGDGMVKIEVTNMPARTSRTAAYTMKVPFSSLSRTMQFIHRSGGKVTSVVKLSASDSFADYSSVPTPTIATPTPAVATVTAPAAPQPAQPAQTAAQNQNERNKNKRGGKNRK